MASAFNNPFRDLKKTVKIPEKPAVQEKPVPPAPRPQEAAESEEEFFVRHMQDVTPLKNDGRVRVTPPPPNLPLRAQTEENEALAELYDLVAGRSGRRPGAGRIQVGGSGIASANSPAADLAESEGFEPSKGF